MFFFGWLLSLLGDAWLFALSLSGKTSFPKPLTAAEEAELIARGGAEARAKLIEHNLRLVAHIAKKYSNSATDSDDLVSIGAIGLVKAVDTFNPGAGKLTPYASRCIENEILMHLRSGKKLRGMVSLDDPIGSDSDGNEIRLIDLLGSDIDAVPMEAEVNIESRRAIELARIVLDMRERRVIALRYGLIDNRPRPQHEVAKILGISRSYISRIEKKALEKLRDAMSSVNT